MNNYMTDKELAAGSGGNMIYDIESYPNYFLIAFMSCETKKIVTFECQYEYCLAEIHKLKWIFQNYKVIGFNNLNYDDPMMSVSTLGYNAIQMNELTKKIIEQNYLYFKIYKDYFLEKPLTIDIMPVAFGSASLKLYAARIGVKKIQNLPYPPETVLTEPQMREVHDYCGNDLEETFQLWKFLAPELAIRETMSARYNVDLMSKSDAQIAETVICNQIKKITGKYPSKPKSLAGTTFNYVPPPYIKFEAVHLNTRLLWIESHSFCIAEDGKVDLPKYLKEPIKIGKIDYTMGIGGLHSVDKTMMNISDENGDLIDIDVSAYYPNNIKNNRLFPKQLGEEFVDIYGGFIDEKDYAKLKGEKRKEATVKIILNGSFGKYGSPYSKLYAPHLLVATTIGGQLGLLMLIEQIELLPKTCVISVNTDGVVVKCHKDDRKSLEKLIIQWEQLMAFNLDKNYYEALYSRDVNNYIAIKKGGKVKRKGTYSDLSIRKNPTSVICSDAVIEKITNDIPVNETIRNCKDIKRFVSVRTAKGGCEKNGVYIGKVVRWYYKKNEWSSINYIGSGNKVNETDGAEPLMNLPDKLPEDLDYDWYIKKANTMLYDIGFSKRPTQIKLF